MDYEDYWDNRADSYDADTVYAVGPGVLDAMASAMLEALPEGSDVIELGCGPGAFTRLYASRSRSVMATDFAPHMVEAAARALAHYPNVSVRVADATATGLPDGSADAVVAMNLIHIVPDPPAVLAEACRLLRPGGTLVVSSYAAEELPLTRAASMGLRALLRFGPRLLRNRTDLTQAKLEALVRQAGFERLEGRLLRGGAANAVFVRAERREWRPPGT
jgi:ubiquinone/menaquinone biosynthesis C-methylase UbiE